MGDKAAARYTHMSAAELATATAEAEGWQPEDGDEVEGVVIAIKSAYSDYKKANYPIVFIMDDEGKVTAVHCFQTVLENEMKSARPKQGEELYIKRIGEDMTKEPRKGESRPIRYSVYVKRETNDDPWAHI